MKSDWLPLWLSGFIALVLIIAPASASFVYHIPVNVQSTTDPQVLMPGDSAVLSIVLQNGAASYGAGSETISGTLSTPINKTILQGTKDIAVESPDYEDIGMIGPTDKVALYYKIRAANNVSNGTYFMDFGVSAGYDLIKINREIPIKVDRTPISIARADVAAKPSINLNIANPRSNTINAVTIVPSAEGVRFSPDQYYIGTMDPDEVFTISFGVDSENPARPISRAVNLSFVAKFKNGDTWHESGPYVTSYNPPRDNSRQNGYLLPAGAGALVLLVAAALLYRRKKMSNSHA
jgi:hypothetical protein